jgi:type II secretory pathway component PulK
MNRASIKCNSRSGFVTTITAMTLLAMVAVAAAELTAAFSADARRTENQQVQAQLRQMLIAGIIQSRQATAIQLPVELRNEDANLMLQGKTITAEMGRRHLSIELPSN